MAALLLSSLRGDAERRFAKVRTGDVRVLEARVPVRRVHTSDAEIVTTKNDPVEGLVLVARRAGTAEVNYERADGRRLRWVIAVREAMPVPISFVRPKNNAPRVSRKPRKPDEAERKANERRLAMRPKPKPRPKPPELKEVKPVGQVVEVDRPAQPKRPDQARFLAEHDSKVDTETQARQKSLKRGQPGAPMPLPAKQAVAEPPAKSAQPPKPPLPAKPAQPSQLATQPFTALRPNTPNPAQPPEPAKPANHQPAPDAKNAASLATPTVVDPSGDRPKTAALPAPLSGPIARPQSEPDQMPDEPSEGALALPPGQRLDLAPSADVLRRALAAGGGGEGGAKAFPDRLKGVKEGEGTFLNTKEWKGASFFNRVKAAVAQKWNPADVYARRDPNGNRYGIKDRYTGLHVTLNGDGSLRHLRVISPSGIDFLDEEAVGAFEAAQPFPNPPDAVKDRDGLIRFSFGFFFEISDRPLLRITR